ncbi:hypothetical protein PABG_11178 [Paracoccidioides brasiliensis Pb03]|nr:hypothetical protein PABG_11178 [Paracoccidioides brasiliensis Pb03]
MEEVQCIHTYIHGSTDLTRGLCHASTCIVRSTGVHTSDLSHSNRWPDLKARWRAVDASSSQAAIIVSDDTTPSMKNSKWTDTSYGILTTQIEKSESGGDRFTIRCHAIDSKLLNTFENGLKADGIENKSKPQGLEGDGKLIDRNPQGPPRHRIQ